MTNKCFTTWSTCGVTNTHGDLRGGCFPSPSLSLKINMLSLCFLTDSVPRAEEGNQTNPTTWCCYWSSPELLQVPHLNVFANRAA